MLTTSHWPRHSRWCTWRQRSTVTSSSSSNSSWQTQHLHSTRCTQQWHRCVYGLHERSVVGVRHCPLTRCAVLYCCQTAYHILVLQRPQASKEASKQTLDACCLYSRWQRTCQAHCCCLHRLQRRLCAARRWWTAGRQWIPDASPWTPCPPPRQAATSPDTREQAQPRVTHAHGG